MKFGLLMNVIILYHYLQYKDIGINYPIYFILLFCLLSKGVNAWYVKFLESIFQYWVILLSKIFGTSSPSKPDTGSNRQQIFSNYQHLMAEEVDLNWFYWQLLSRRILNWKCRIRAALWEPAGSQWFYIFFMTSLALTFVLGIKSPQSWLNSSLLHLISLTELHLLQARFKIAVFWLRAEMSCSVREKSTFTKFSFVCYLEIP